MKAFKFVTMCISIMVVIPMLLVGCATTKTQNADGTTTTTRELTPAAQLLVNAAANDVGYFGYLLVPESRMPLNTICAITGTDAESMQLALTGMLGKIWTASNTPVGSAVAMKINQIVGTLKTLIAQKAGDSTVIAFCQNVIAQICIGVSSAQGMPTAAAALRVAPTILSGCDVDNDRRRIFMVGLF